jgi:hypothetical protein
MARQAALPLIAALTASSALLAQTPPAQDGGRAPTTPQDGGVGPAPSGSASAAPVTDEPPLVMLEGGVAARRAAATPVDAPPEERYKTQRGFAILAAGGMLEGFGLGARVGTPRIGLDLSGGYLPVLATYSRDSQHSPKFKVLSSLQANATVVFGLCRPGRRTDMGVAIGYRYNDVLKHGFSAAFYLQYDIAEHWALNVFAGPAIFPKAENGIRKEAGWPAEGSVGSGMSWNQGGLGLQLAFYP